MIGDGDEFIAALNSRIRHRANIAGAIAPMRVHLQIAAKARAPRRRFSQLKTSFGQAKKFFPERRRTRRMLVSPNPLADLFLKKRSNMRQLCQCAFLCDQVARLDFPEKRASRGPAISTLQNIGSFARFARK